MKSGLDKVKSLARATVNWWSRSLWLEILAFVAVAIFAFSVVSTLLDKDESIVALAAPDLTLQQAADVPALYEAESQRATTVSKLSPVFTPSVLYWEDEIVAWASEWGIDPNAAATLMQIESCGNPSAESWAGASGLFQVMPFHFAEGENRFDPATNARRGLDYFAQALQRSGGHVGLAMAGYNGGIGIIPRDYNTWPTETQRYYRWGTGIYREATAGWDSSPTLETWLEAGGRSLCNQAEENLGLR